MSDLTILEWLVTKLQPRYVGYDDQYKAILHTLGIDVDTPYSEVLAATGLLDKPAGGAA